MSSTNISDLDGATLRRINKLKAAYARQGGIVRGLDRPVKPKHYNDNQLLLAAQACATLGVTPEEYMRLAFLVWERGTGPLPNQLGCDTMVRKIQEHLHTHNHVLTQQTDDGPETVKVPEEEYLLAYSLESARKTLELYSKDPTVNLVEDVLLHPGFNIHPVAQALFGRTHPLVREEAFPVVRDMLETDANLLGYLQNMGLGALVEEVLRED